jgi:hypothetical protein
MQIIVKEFTTVIGYNRGITRIHNSVTIHVTDRPSVELTIMVGNYACVSAVNFPSCRIGDRIGHCPGVFVGR